MYLKNVESESIFKTVTPVILLSSVGDTDRQTDRHTDTQTDRQTTIALRISDYVIHEFETDR